MATIRPGYRPVVLVVDAQVGVLRQAWEAGRITGNIARLVERARADAVPVLWVQHHDDELARDSADWQLVPQLGPAAGEATIHKSFNSSFEGTDLDAQLAAHEATQLIVAGAATSWCIRATLYAALERGYDVCLVRDAHTTEPMESMSGVRIDPAQIVEELNTVMMWLKYPGRINGIAFAEHLDFQSE